MRKRHRENPIKIGNTQVPFYNEIKYLGITIPNELNLVQHINKKKSVDYSPQSEHYSYSTGKTHNSLNRQE